jgi:hypothetical protein
MGSLTEFSTLNISEYPKDADAWRSAAAVLFERESLLRNPPQSREERKETTTSFASSSHGGYQEGVGTIRASGGDLGGKRDHHQGVSLAGPLKYLPLLTLILEINKDRKTST